MKRKSLTPKYNGFILESREEVVKETKEKGFTE